MKETTTGKNTKQVVKLPTEVIDHHILPRLPVKSLMRFKCVCKSWYSLIGDPFFSVRHKSFYPPRRSKILITSYVNEDKELRLLSLPVKDKINLGPPVRLLTIPAAGTFSGSVLRVQHANGLLCIQMGAAVYIVNPSTRQVMTLPHENINNGANNITYSLGLTRETNEYKVVKLWLHDLSRTFECEVYKLSSGSWRCTSHVVSPYHGGKVFYNVCLNGLLYWLVRDRWSEFKYILTFDLDRESFGEIRVPERIETPLSLLPQMFDADGSLAIIVFGGVPDHRVAFKFDIWVLKNHKDGRIWVKAYNDCIIVPEIWSKDDSHHPCLLSGIIHTGEIVLAPIVTYGNSIRLVIYDLKRKCCSREAYTRVDSALLFEDKVHYTTYEENIIRLPL